MVFAQERFLNSQEGDIALPESLKRGKVPVLTERTPFRKAQEGKVSFKKKYK